MRPGWLVLALLTASLLATNTILTRGASLNKSWATIGMNDTSILTISAAGPQSTLIIESGWKRGDVNSDGSVNSLDITTLERVIARLDNRTTADVNLDSRVNALDITSLERIIVGYEQ